MPCTIEVTGPASAEVKVTEGDISGSSGQSLVVYEGDTLLGGGVIDLAQ